MDADFALSCGRFFLNLLDSIAADKTWLNVFVIMSCLPPTYPLRARVFDDANLQLFSILMKKNDKACLNALIISGKDAVGPMVGTQSWP